MISGLCHAYQATKCNDYLTKALEASDFIRKNLFNQGSHQLLRSCYVSSEDGSIIYG